MRGRAPGWLQDADFQGPRVAIIGRTNVGKSTLFNRLAGRTVAIADKTAGVTRDRKEAQGKLVDLNFIMVDTPGIEELEENIDRTENEIYRSMIEQCQYAIECCQIILFLIDGKIGITKQDIFLANWLQNKLGFTNKHEYGDSFAISESNLIDNKYLIPIANKCEMSTDCNALISDGFRLGFGELVCLSSRSGEGLTDLFYCIDDVFNHLDRWTNIDLTNDGTIDKSRIKNGQLNSNTNEMEDDGDDGDENDDDDKFNNVSVSLNDNNELSFISVSRLKELIENDNNGDSSDRLDDNGSDTDASHVGEINMNENGADGNDSDVSNNLDQLFDSLSSDPFTHRYNGSIDISDEDFDISKFDIRIDKGDLNHDSDSDEFNDDEDDLMDFQTIEKDGIDGMEDLDTEKVLNEMEIKNASEHENINGNENENSEYELKLCVVGRPNVGKSSLINAILGENRCLIGDQPGITRDCIAISMKDKYSGRQFKIIDTAGLIGIKRGTYLRARQDSRLNILVMRECLRSVRYSNVVALVIDINDDVLNSIEHIDIPQKLLYYQTNEAIMDEKVDANINIDKTEESEVDFARMHVEARSVAHKIVSTLICDFDREMIRYIISQGRGCMLVINKWDKMNKLSKSNQIYQGNNNNKNNTIGKEASVLKLLQLSLPLVFSDTGGLPVLITSAKYHINIDELTSTAINIYDKWNLRLKTPVLNKFIREMQKVYSPPKIKQVRRFGRWKRYIEPKVKYLTQYTTRPPSFIAFCGTQIISDHYFNRMKRLVRKEYGLIGVPMRIHLKSNSELTKHQKQLHDIMKERSKNGRELDTTQPVTGLGFDKLFEEKDRKTPDKIRLMQRRRWQKLSQVEQSRLLRYGREKEKKLKEYNQMKYEKKQQAMEIKKQFSRKLTRDKILSAN